MLQQIKKYWLIVFPILKNKFVLTILLFVIWISFFDQNSLIERKDAMQKKSQLEADKSFFLERIEEDKARMNELLSDDKNLEKFAREKYLMKKKNEDIFIIIEEEED